MTELQRLKSIERKSREAYSEAQFNKTRYLTTFIGVPCEITCDGVNWIEVGYIKGGFGSIQFYIEDGNPHSLSYIDDEDVIDIRRIDEKEKLC